MEPVSLVPMDVIRIRTQTSKRKIGKAKRSQEEGEPARQGC